MRILLTGATGYIGQRLLPLLLAQSHEVVCAVRDPSRFELMPEWEGKVEVLECDFLSPPTCPTDWPDLDVAYYLIHSMGSNRDDFEKLEEKTARHFTDFVEQARCKQIIYLSGIANAPKAKLSPHLRSRLQVEEVLRAGQVPATVIRAGIIVGSGSASFEIIRDLVEKLPVMVAPKWLRTKCQPVAVRNVLHALTGVIDLPEAIGETFDFGGPDVLSYKEMLLGYAKVRGLKRHIKTLPLMSPRLSSFWLYFITSTNYSLARNLVASMKVDVVARDNRLQSLLGLDMLGYEEAVDAAFLKIKQNVIVSSWTDALSSSFRRSKLSPYIEVPDKGCFHDRKEVKITHNSVEQVKRNLWAIGGKRGWYYASFLWKMRGWLDKVVGGVGLRRGRTHPQRLDAGDALDFWRVLVADPESGRLLLFAEMKLPGEAWLEWKIEEREDGHYLCQHAVFRPNGLAGRLYWYSVLPFHLFVFGGMVRNIERFKPDQGKRKAPGLMPTSKESISEAEAAS